MWNGLREGTSLRMKAFKRARREGMCGYVLECGNQNVGSSRRREEEGTRMFGALNIISAEKRRHRTTPSPGFGWLFAVLTFDDMHFSPRYRTNALLLGLVCFTRSAFISYRASSGSRLPGICARPASRGEPAVLYFKCAYTTKHILHRVLVV